MVTWAIQWPCIPSSWVVRRTTGSKATETDMNTTGYVSHSIHHSHTVFSINILINIQFQHDSFAQQSPLQKDVHAQSQVRRFLVPGQ